MIIAFIKPTPKFVERFKDGGQFNGYLLIPKEYSNISIPEPHGGITLKITNSKDIKEFIDKSPTFWESGNIEHPDYSEYFCVGFDTLHIGDTWENWDMESVWEETVKYNYIIRNNKKKTDMNKKLRLLVTTKCPNKCPMCCNNSWDFDKLPVVDRWNYDEIMITGGEPMLYSRNLFDLIKSIKIISKIESGKTPKIYVYTAYCLCDVVDILNSNYIDFRADGIVLTPHKSSDIDAFIYTNEFLLQYKHKYKKVSLRLNLFPDMKALLPKDIDLSLWQVKDMEWIKDCPVPEGEDFRRIANLW